MAPLGNAGMFLQLPAHLMKLRTRSIDLSKPRASPMASLERP